MNDNSTAGGWGSLGVGAIEAAPTFLHLGVGELRPLVVLRDQPEPYLGHWMSALKQFVPCGGAVCQMCLAGLGKQERFVFPVADEQSGVWLWECGRLQAAVIFEAVQLAGHMRGLELTLYRAAAPGNPPVIVTLLGLCDSERDMPPAPDVLGLLQEVWQRQSLRLGKGGRAAIITAEKQSASVTTVPTGTVDDIPPPGPKSYLDPGSQIALDIAAHRARKRAM